MKSFFRKGRGRIKKLKDTGDRRLVDLYSVHLLMLRKEVHQVLCKSNIGKVTRKKAFVVGPKCEGLSMRVVHITGGIPEGFRSHIDDSVGE